MDMKKFHEYPAFSELSACKEAVTMYQSGKKAQQVSDYYGVPMRGVRSLLDFYGVERRKSTIKKEIDFTIRKKGKYDYLIFEPRSQGKDYKTLLKEKGIKLTKSL